MNAEETIRAAVTKMQRSILDNGGSDPVTDATIQVLNAGLTWFDDWQDGEDWTYPDDRPMIPGRMFLITPHGRACLALAEAILGES